MDIGINEIYKKWSEATEEKKEDLYGCLFKATRAFVSARIGGKDWKKTHPELADEIATDIMLGLRGFRGEALYSTWVMGILKRKRTDYVEEKKHRRSRFVSVTPTDFVEDDENENGEIGAAVCVKVVDDIEGRTRLEEIRQNVRERDTQLYEGVECGLD